MMRVLRVIVLSAVLAITLANADDCRYAEYRFSKILGQVQITTGYTERTPEMTSREAELEK
jgi:hypothetical protein